MPIKDYTVAKFGGTSMADYEAMQRAARIVASDHDTRVVVVSATAGTTNLLNTLADPNAAESQRRQAFEDIRHKHERIIGKLKKTDAAEVQFEDLINQLEDKGFHAGESFTPRWRDEILSFGELISSTLFAEICRQENLDAVWMDAREVIKTDSLWGSAEPQVSEIRETIRAQWLNVLDKQIIITQGFIGSDPYNRTTTLGRGGSDYSAALIAEALDSKILKIWTDVTAIFSCDPRVVPDAQPLHEISFDEAAELSTFGAKILHPATLWPAIRSNIRVYVGSSMQPGVPGTWIAKKTGDNPAFRALSIRRKQTLLTVESLDMFQRYGFLARLFSVLARYKISVDLVTTSEVSVSLTLDNLGYVTGQETLPQNLLEELRSFCHVRIEENLALIALIGNNLNKTKGVSGALFKLLEDYNIRLICHGASPYNLCFLVSDSDADQVARKIHRHFLKDRMRNAETGSPNKTDSVTHNMTES